MTATARCSSITPARLSTVTPILLMAAIYLKDRGKLPGPAVVATVMSNIGLEIALRDRGIEMVRTAVGDKYVMEEMVRRGFALGGEQSGHVIFSDHLFTGDGLATALNVLRIMADTGKELSELAGALVTYPQVLVNVRVKQKTDLDTVPAIAETMKKVEAGLAGKDACSCATQGQSRCCGSCSRARTTRRSRAGRRKLPGS